MWLQLTVGRHFSHSYLVGVCSMHAAFSSDDRHGLVNPWTQIKGGWLSVVGEGQDKKYPAKGAE